VIRLLFAMIAAAGLVALNACGNGEAERMGAAMDALKEQAAAVEAQNDNLRQQHSDLQQRFSELKESCDNRAIELSDLKEWSRQLVESIGPSVWYPGTYERPVLKKVLKTATPTQLTRELNRLFTASDLPRVSYSGQKGGIAFISIGDAEMLTQNLGTTGAQSYLAAVTFTYCSLKEINCVEVEFKAGQHAFPGRYCR
jgi:hypothetical protein